MINATQSYLEENYTFQPETKSYRIDVSVNTFDELFNALDPSPLKKRDLSPDLRSFLEDCGQEIPLKYPVNLTIRILEENQDPLQEREASTGVRHYFSCMVHSTRSGIQQTRIRALKFILASFLSLCCAWLLRGVFDGNFLFDFFREGLTISGWVFLWETISLVFVQPDALNGQVRRYLRYQKSDIRYVYGNSGG